MKQEYPPESDEPLRKLIQEWNVTPPLPTRFQESVWRRIDHAECSEAPAATKLLWEKLTAWMASVLPRPAVAVAYVTVLFVAGMAAGYWRARDRTAHLDNELAARYVQSVDPYQKPHI